MSWLPDNLARAWGYVLRDVAALHICPFRTLECGAQEYTEADDADGWCVFLRIETPNDPQQPFDIMEAGDFETLEAAEASARGWATLFFGDPENWCAY